MFSKFCLRLNRAVPSTKVSSVSRAQIVLGGIRSFNSKSQPGPPELPKEDQEEFEKLQKLANSQEAIEKYNKEIQNDHTKESLRAKLMAKNDVGSFSPDYRGTIPEFEGDVNPVTGEIGGPKQDPLRHGDYSFNGRVTDF